MSKCNDHWCDYYGNDSKMCDRCEKKDSINDKPVLRVILKRRADVQMELDKMTNKTKGQER